MNDLTYVTGNYGKYLSVKEHFENEGLIINYCDFNLDELDINDISLISKKKALDAYKIVKSPVFVADTGFYIKNYPNNPNYPGAFVKRSGISSNIDELLKVMKDEKKRDCYFLDCLTFYDGNSFYQFYGKSEGVLSTEKRGEDLKRAKSNLWYVFIPKNNVKTLAEMTDYERNNRHDDHTSATLKFIDWYKNEYAKIKKW